MYNNYDYPMGADTPLAPWNMPVVPYHEFNVAISQTLSKSTVVSTNDYTPCCDEGCEDGVGYHDEWDDTSETNWTQVYEEDHKTPYELIAMLKEYLEKELKTLRETMEPDDRSFKVTQARRLEGLIEECEDWVVDETEIVEE